MKNILKFLFVSILIPLLFSSCKDEAYDNNWTTPEASFKLYDTTLGSNILYPTMESNPFILTWDNTTSASGNYSVVISATEDFANKIELGTSGTNTYKTTIGDLNTAMLQAGLSPYSPQIAYVRVEVGSAISNTISFTVTPYPVEIPVITNPTAGSSFILDSQNADTNATTVTWNDYSTYGVDVNYTLELAAKGSSDYIVAGTTTNLKTYDFTNKSLNDVVLKTGAQANVETEVDLRVTASTESTGGTITKTSDVVTFKVTPYQAFKNLYLVGDATAAGWSTNNNNQPIFRDPNTTSKFYFTGKFGTSMFKLLEVLGDNTWQPQWGLKNGVVANSDGGDPDPFTTSSSGYYTFEIDIIAKTYSLVPYTGSPNTYATIDLAGDLNGWSGSTLLTRSTFDSHQWFVKDLVVSSNGGAKFRANGSWDINWGSGTEFSGQGTQGGDNIPLNAGTYDVYFNDIDGRYIFIKK